MNTITITVKSVNIVKTGVRNDNSTWTLMNVIDENDRKYSTFDETYLKTIGKTITINYEEKESGMNQKTGKPFINRTIVAPKKDKTTQGATQVWAERLIAKVKELDERVKKLEVGGSINEDQAIAQANESMGEIDPSTIPF